MSKLQVILDTLIEKIDAIRERKLTILGKIRKMQGEAQQKVIDFLDRVEKLEAECAEVSQDDLTKFGIDPKNIDNFKAACADAKKEINAFKTNVLEPILTQNSVPADVDLEVEFCNAPLWPELQPKLAELQSAVEQAEQLGEEVLKVRIEFMKALNDLEEPIAAARNDLDTVIKGRTEIAGQGIDDSDFNLKLHSACRLDTKLEGLQVHARDPDGFRATAAQFLDAVAAGKAALEAAREEIRRREAELKERKELQDQLEDISGVVNQAEESVLKSMEKMIGGSDDSRKIPDIRALITKSIDLSSRVYTMDLDELRANVEALQEKSQADVQKLKDLHKDAEQQNKQKFADLRAKYANRANVAPPPLPRHRIR